MPDIVQDLSAILLDAVAATLRQTGFYPRPQVHMFAENIESPYIGYIVCRPFCRGDDAVTAITGLGLLPSVMALARSLVPATKCIGSVATAEQRRADAHRIPTAPRTPFGAGRVHPRDPEPASRPVGVRHRTTVAGQ
jgi:hypothetical protein